MPASQDARSEHVLSDTLSARSYLELAQEAFQLQPEEHTPQSLRDSVLEDPIDMDGKSGPRLRPRKRRPSRKEESKESENPETVSESRDPHAVDRPVRKRGRPRLETAKDAAAIEERRLQIRRAQRTYRQKKEATIQTLKTRVEVLEQTLQNVSDLLGAVDPDGVDAPNAIGLLPDNLTRIRQRVLAEVDKTRSYSGHSTQVNHGPGSLHDLFGYQVSHPRTNLGEGTDPYRYQKRSAQLPTHPHPRSPSPLLNRLFPSTTIYTYSHQESSLSRRLQRYCLEHTYRWLADPHSDPALMSRVFGLLPCIHDMPGVRRNFRRVLQSEIGGPLEVNKLPFYTLGGAGTHYPRFGSDGQPLSPENLRRPGKILRRLARILRRGGIRDWDEDWSGNAEPDREDGPSQESLEMNDEDRLRLLDLDGEWFDCHDVQGYLEHRGVVLDGSRLWLEIPATTVHVLYGLSPDRSASQFYMSSDEASPLETSGSQYLSQSTYVLDVECFFDLLLTNLRILGRAPGFRLWDVDAALRTAIHRRPFA